MIVHLDQVCQGPVDLEETLSAEAGDVEHETLRALGPVQCRGEVSFTDPDFLLRAELTYPRTLICDRCLEDFEEQAESELVMVVSREGESELADELELGEQDLHLLVVDGESFDTRPLVFEQIALDLPMKPLCSAECPGLCPTCGGRRGDCDCAEPSGDPRFAVLEQLRDRLG